MTTQRNRISASPLNRVLDSLEGVVRENGHFKAFCPVHLDGRKRGRPSLQISLGDDGKVLLYCYAGCPTPLVLEELGMDYSDLYPDSDQSDKPVKYE